MASKRGRVAEFELAKSTAKRDLYFAEIEELYQLSLNVDNRETATMFLTRFSGYNEIQEKFLNMVEVVNDLQFQLDSNFQPDYSMLRTAERWRFSILDAAKNLKKDEVKASTPSCSFKLPKISLPEFHGEITQWPLFFEKFDSIIHRNPSLDDLAKMHYLLGALKGKALDVCVGLTPTAANYPILLQALKSRYDNKRVLADHFFNQILDVKPLTQESASGLGQVLLRVDTAYKSLQNLSLPNLTDYMMAYLLLSKLDPQTRRAFETSKHEQIPSYPEILQFLHAQVDALTQLPKIRNSPPRNSNAVAQSHSSTTGWKTFVNQVAPLSKNKNNDSKKGMTKPITCPVCSNSHQVFKCESFRKMSPSDRLKLAQKGNWCVNCLSNSHSVKACNSRFTCQICHNHHHTLLHLGTSQENPSSSSQPTPQPEERPPCNFFTNSTSNSARNPPSENVPLLPTALIRIETPFGDREARFLIDSGSQRNFISQACCREINLSYQRKLVPLEGMGNVPLQAIGVTKFFIKSMLNSKTRFQVSALVTEKITHHLPPDTVHVDNLHFLQDLQLADREFFRPGRIDGILGAQIFGKILTGPAVAGLDQSTHAVPTSLGHIVMGEAPRANPETHSQPGPVSTFCILDNQGLNQAVQQFWELEEVPRTPKLSKEEKACEETFQATTTRVLGQRYCVELPFKEFPPELGDSFQMAEKRFHSLERRFKKDPGFRSQYAAVVEDYLSQGHFSLVTTAPSADDNAYFIPHFAVLKESSSTPLRIVFDASARTSNGRSLNDVLFTGPKLQKNITQILLSFRISAVALLADIRQMYRNILVHPKHRPFQRILWRNSSQEPLQVYQLNCVVFGVTSAPFLALRTIQQLAADEAKNFPLAARLASNHMYVDDLVVSLESVSSALEAYKQLEGFFTAGGFKLAKWASNSPEVLEAIPSDQRVSQLFDFSDSSRTNDVIKVLGLTWDSMSDTFSFKTKSLTPVFTKRGVLSVIARIWDPLGFLAPVTLYAKVLVKELWNIGLDWDDVLSPPFHAQWQQFSEELPRLQEIKIPRYFGPASEPSVTLVGFADSSERGYGAVVYLRLPSETPEVRLLYAKSRVAPQKTVTLPKLELCAAVLLAEIMHVCAETLSTQFHQISKFALTDSSVTLAWIKNDSLKRETFVANRITAIERYLSPEEWYHVRSENNIADIISRGLTPAQLKEHPSWINGPSWLRLDPEDWPIQADIPPSVSANSEIIASPPEKSVTLLCVIPNNEGIEPLSRPLCTLSDDPAEPTALTPAHFLTLTPLRSLPLLTAEQPSHSLRTRKEFLDSLLQSFWRRWHSEYLTTLQPRKKWCSPAEPLKVGTVVVVRHDANPPLRWPLGVVEQIHPGKDGVVRVATIRMGKTLLQRPAAKLCPLPTQ